MNMEGAFKANLEGLNYEKYFAASAPTAGASYNTAVTVSLLVSTIYKIFIPSLKMLYPPLRMSLNKERNNYSFTIILIK